MDIYKAAGKQRVEGKITPQWKLILLSDIVKQKTINEI